MYPRVFVCVCVRVRVCEGVRERKRVYLCNSGGGEGDLFECRGVLVSVRLQPAAFALQFLERLRWRYTSTPEKRKPGGWFVPTFTANALLSTSSCLFIRFGV